jgi:hypothetical protein
MSFTITFGYWLIPLAITILSYVGLPWLAVRDDGSSYGSIFNGLFVLLSLLVATIISLISWLIYAVVM